MNHNDNTSGYILSNYLSNIFHLHQRRPSSDPEDARTPRDPDGVLSCVMPCRNPDPRPPKRISRPDPNDLTTFQDHQRRLLAGSGSLLCCVMCRNTPPA
jgi:hypothetical protein